MVSTARDVLDIVLRKLKRSVVVSCSCSCSSFFVQLTFFLDWIAVSYSNLVLVMQYYYAGLWETTYYYTTA